MNFIHSIGKPNRKSSKKITHHFATENNFFQNETRLTWMVP